MEVFLYWVFLFFLFNVMGWVMESTIESLNHKRLINRGFFTGPYIPLYGAGGVMFAAIGIPLKTAFDSPAVNAFLVFFVGMSVATLMEYAAGSALERLFNKTFWDYSALKLTQKFTYKNRISLVSSLFFGVLSLFMTYCLYGIVEKVVRPFVQTYPYLVLTINCVMTVVMLGDGVVQLIKHGRMRNFLEGQPLPKLKEALFAKLLQVGRNRQIREFRETVLNNINNIKGLLNGKKEPAPVQAEQEPELAPVPVPVLIQEEEEPQTKETK